MIGVKEFHIAKALLEGHKERHVRERWKVALRSTGPGRGGSLGVGSLSCDPDSKGYRFKVVRLEMWHCSLIP